MTSVGSRAPAVTPMSHRVVACEPDQGSARLARRSLTALSMAFALLAAGCIVADPPNSSDPEKTPPLLLLGQADPPVFQVMSLSTKDGSTSLPINVPVRSEDAGDELIALLFVDWNVDSNAKEPVAKARVAPSTFDDANRMISATWDYSGAPSGCNQLTMLVTHSTNYDWIPSTYANPADVAIATWFFNVNDEPRGTNPLSWCPSSAGGL
jgi:hypothetical protein